MDGGEFFELGDDIDKSFGMLLVDDWCNEFVKFFDEIVLLLWKVGVGFGVEDVYVCC